MLDAIGIVVGDMAASVAFYRRLGVPFPAPEEVEGHVEAELASGMRLMLDSEEVVGGFDPSFRPPTGRGRIGLAFRCASPAAVDETFHGLVAAGHRSHLEPFDAFWGQRYAAVLDPDGNVVDLYAPSG